MVYSGHKKKTHGAYCLRICTSLSATGSNFVGIVRNSRLGGGFRFRLSRLISPCVYIRGTTNLWFSYRFRNRSLRLHVSHTASERQSRKSTYALAFTCHHPRRSLIRGIYSRWQVGRRLKILRLIRLSGNLSELAQRRLPVTLLHPCRYPPFEHQNAPRRSGSISIFISR